MKFFKKVLSKLRGLSNSELNTANYAVPGLWVNSENETEVFHPIDYFISQFENILSIRNVSTTSKPLADSIIYNMMPRYTTAFDHFDKKDQNYYFEFNRNGSILKTIALLPYIKSLGTDILYFLPIYAIARQNRKGNIGSVYSIRNAYTIDENLAESFLEIDLNLQFKALVEAAHHLGIKVVTEFIFRTVATDSDLILQHPDWFYWIKEDSARNFHAPVFTPDELKTIKAKVENKDFSNLIPPHEDYISNFTDTPERIEVEKGKYIGITSRGERAVVPCGFADWPPDDNQPMWSDVTYFNMYSDKRFNYQAYNTIRMYDDELRNGNSLRSDLKQYLINIVPDYIQNFNIDGIMLDMGHALPDEIRQEIISATRNAKPNFLLFEENFIPNELSKQDGFDAVVGYLPFDFADHDKMCNYIYRIQIRDLALPSFGTLENHNTKRTQNYHHTAEFSKLIWTLASFLPDTIRFIHSGFELLETQPVNTGLGFTDEEIAALPPESLPLFSSAKLKWNAEFVPTLCEINELRNCLIDDCGKSISDFQLTQIHTESGSIMAYILKDNEVSILVVANFSETLEKNKLNLPFQYKNFVNSSSNINFVVYNNSIELELNPFEVLIGQLQ